MFQNNISKIFKNVISRFLTFYSDPASACCVCSIFANFGNQPLLRKRFCFQSYQNLMGARTFSPSVSDGPAEVPRKFSSSLKKKFAKFSSCTKNKRHDDKYRKLKGCLNRIQVGFNQMSLLDGNVKKEPDAENMY